MRRAVAIAGVGLSLGCSFAHEYRSGEVPRLQVYDGSALAGALRPCEFPGGELRRNVEGTRLLLFTLTPTGGADCSAPETFVSAMVTLEQGKAPTRMVLPSDDAIVGDDGQILGHERYERQGVFEFAGGQRIEGYVELRRDKSGAPYYSAWHHPEGTEIAPLASPGRVLARSPLRGLLFSKGSLHYVCGMNDVGPRGQGACDRFVSEALGEWEPAGRLDFGHHQVVDMDPASDLALVATQRDDLELLLFTVDLKTWEWKYLGAGPAWSLLFMNVDPLGRPQTAAPR